MRESLNKELYSVSIKVDKDMKEFIKDRSNRLRLSESEMVRNAILFDAIADGDIQGIKLLCDVFREKARIKIKNFVRSSGKSGVLGS